MDLTRKQALTGLAGILATGVAPAAFVRSMIGARGVAISQSSGGAPTAKSYVLSGLTCLFDGIENSDWGSHDEGASTWKNLVGVDSAQLPSAVYVEADRVEIRRATGIQLTNFSPTISFTVEYCFSPFDTNTFRECLFESKTANLGFRYKKQAKVIDLWNSSDPMADKVVIDVVAGVRSTIASSFVLNNSTLYGSDYANGTKVRGWSLSRSSLNIGGFQIGRPSAPGYTTYQDVMCVRIYDRVLSDQEIAANYAVDKARFGLT